MGSQRAKGLVAATAVLAWLLMAPSAMEGATASGT